MAEIEHHRDYLIETWEAAQAAPLSAKKLMLAALLADAYADRLFAMQDETRDILAFRAGLAARSAALAQVFALVRGELRLVTEAVEVPLADYGTLRVEDFMVSLYNDNTVQRVRLVLPDGQRVLAHPVVGEAVGYLSSASA